MDVSQLCSRELYVVGLEELLAHVVREMQKRAIGAAVVVEATNSRRRPIGILTDRDILCRQLVRQADLFTMTAADVMTRDPLTIPENTGIAEAIRHLRACCVRRAPVVSAHGDAVGMISLDDLLPAVADELNNLAALLGARSHHGRQRSADV